MFLLAKLVGVMGTVLSSGTISAFLIPYFQNKKADIFSKLLYQENLAINKFDLGELDEKAKQNIELLNEKISAFSLAKNITSSWKGATYVSILQLFDFLNNLEKQLSDLYQEIMVTLKQIISKNEEIFNYSKEKLETEKEKKLNEIFKEAYTKLNVYLTDWESYMKQINCEINQNKNCKHILSDLSNFIGKIFPFLPIINSSTGADGNLHSLSAQTELPASKKAKQELLSISSDISKLISEIEQQNNSYRAKQLSARLKEKLLLTKLLYLEQTIKWLLIQHNDLETSIKSKNNSQKLIDSINSSKEQLITKHNNYKKLIQQEIQLHYWKSKLEENLLKNKSDLMKEVQTHL